MGETEQENPLKEAKVPRIRYRTQCEICGSIYNKKNRTRHLQTEKHKQAKYIWQERFEITR